MICKYRFNQGDVDSDGLPEVIVTYLMGNANYSSEIYDVSCSTNCQIILQTIDFTLLSNMSAVPFLIDSSGSGNISFYTFSNSNRTIVYYSNNPLSLYNFDKADKLHYGAALY